MSAPAPPETNGVVERLFGTLKYEHMYRIEIGDVRELQAEIDASRLALQHLTSAREAGREPTHRSLRWPQPTENRAYPETV